MSTERGKALTEVLPEEVKSPKLTSDWEMMLQDIGHGSGNADEFMSGIIELVREICKNYSQTDTNENFGNRTVIGKCPRCGKNIYEGKMSYYCESGKDGCNFTLWKEQKGLHTVIDVGSAEK